MTGQLSCMLYGEYGRRHWPYDSLGPWELRAEGPRRSAGRPCSSYSIIITVIINNNVFVLSPCMQAVLLVGSMSIVQR
jgi:hypothetical protein